MKSLAERLYSVLLLAYPASFRSRYRGDLMAYFRSDRERQRRAARPLGWLRFWGATLWDLTRAATTERLAALGRSVKLGHRPSPSARPNAGPREKTILMETLLQDFRYAVRTLRRSPGFTAVALATLALGIGATAAMFSVVNGVLLEDMPYGDPDRIVTVWGTDTDGRFPVSENERLRYREQSIFESFGTYRFFSGNMLGVGDARRVVGAALDADVSAALGMTAVTGRTFTSDESQPGGDLVALLSYDMWQRDFGGRSDVVGQTLVLAGRTRTVVGVVPREFRLPGDFVGQPVQLYIPQVFGPDPDPENIHYLSAVALFNDGVSIEGARDRLAALSLRLREELPTLPPTFTAAVVPVRQQVLGEVRPVLLILLGSVALVLVIACVNVANLFLSRADGRRREISIRAALGAGRGRIVRQLLTESVVLAAIGGGLGVAIAALAGDVMIRFNPTNIPRIDQIGVDFRVVAFTAAMSLVAALLAGLVPALSASRGVLRGSLQDIDKNTTSGVRRGKLRQLLVMSEMALAVMLTIGAGLLLKSFRELSSVPPGFDPTQVLTAQISLPAADYPDAQSARAFYRDLLEHIRSMPSVAAAGAITQLPLASNPGDWGIRIEGREEERLASGRRPFADRLIVTAGYFEVLRIPLVAGRTFSTADHTTAAPVVVINEETARRYWPNESAIGKRFYLSANIDTVYRTVIGVVHNVKHGGLGAEARPEMYLPHSQHPSSQDFPIGTMTIVIRANGDPVALTGELRRAVTDIDATVPLARLRTMESVVQASTASERLNVVLFGVFGLLGLALVSVGVYGVMSHFISQRTREFGIRLALGATPRLVLGTVVAQGLGLAIVGSVIGVSGALALGRFLSGLLFGVAWNDLATFVAVPALVTGLAVLACVVPARRATRVDTIEVLRAE